MSRAVGVLRFWIVTLFTIGDTDTNCITENVTLRSIVASGKMLLSDRRTSLLEERHDEPEEQVRVVGNGATEIPESEQAGKAKDAGRVYVCDRLSSKVCHPGAQKSSSQAPDQENRWLQTPVLWRGG